MSTPSFSLKGKVALISGARRGIGKAIALTFAGAGADVAICDNVVEGGELGAVAEEIQRLGQRSLPMQADISQKTDVDNMVHRLISEFGGIDILVNNAVMFNRVPLLEVCEEDWDRQIDVALKGYFLCCQAVAETMIERKKGNIISIASVAGMMGATGRGAYNIAKAGVIMLTKVLAGDLAKYKIRANAIAPGFVGTEYAFEVAGGMEGLKQLGAQIPLGRVAEPSEIANVALFLASDASGYITGHTIVADGGIMA